MSATRLLVCSCLALLASVPASAQSQPYRPERPYRGIFASGVDGLGQSLTGRVTFSGGYDDNLLADATQQDQIASGVKGGLGQVSSSLNYGLIGSRGQLNAGAGMSTRYYPSMDTKYLNTYGASIGGIVRVLTGPNLTLRHETSYQPFTFLAQPTPAGMVSELDIFTPPDPDFVPIASQYVAYESGADFDAQLTRRLTFSTQYTHRLSDRRTSSFWRQSGSTGFKYGLTRDLSLRTMYGYSEAHYPDRVIKTHTPDVGLDFARALSLTRRTSLGFGVGTEARIVNDETRWQAIGHADVRHEIGRSWLASASYNRGTYYVDTLDAPVFGDTARAGLNGLITRRLEFQAAVSASIGNTGFTVQRQFDSYLGTVSLSTALNRFMNVGADYAYYKYVLDPSIQLEPGLPHQVNRQSIRAHVSFWAPLINKTRRRDASR